MTVKCVRAVAQVECVRRDTAFEDGAIDAAGARADWYYWRGAEGPCAGQAAPVAPVAQGSHPTRRWGNPELPGSNDGSSASTDELAAKLLGLPNLRWRHALHEGTSALSGPF